MERTRRRHLAGIASCLAAAAGGCLSADLDSDGGPTGPSDGSGTEFEREGYAAFFTPADLATQVGGERFLVRDPVPTGTPGHGWEPGADLLPRIAESDLFVYLDTPEFRWSQDAAETVGDDVVVVDALEGIDLMNWDSEDGNGNHVHEEEHSHAEEQEGGHDGEESHDHGAHDPHAWVDPLNAETMVDNVVEGIVEADPDNEAYYRENAEAYRGELRTVHQRFEEIVEEAEHDVVVVAGHDSYQYLGARYGIEFHSPAGVSPHDQPSVGEIAETVELVDEVGIDYVLYNVFEDTTLAESIVSESEATDVLPVTPVQGTTEEWAERGWGYVEQMEEINIPAIERALGVEA